MTRRLRAAHPLFIALFLALALPPAAIAVRDSGSGSPASGCTQNAPRVSVANTFAWASPGSWGFPGQQLAYSVGVSNADSGCSSSSFVVKVSAPTGFAVSTPTSTMTVNSGSTGYLRVYVTSPATAADGDYPLTVTVEHAGAPSPATKSSTRLLREHGYAEGVLDNVSDGAVLSGRTTYVGFASSDDHAVKKLEVFLDNVLVAAKDCDNVAYSASYPTSGRFVMPADSTPQPSVDRLQWQRRPYDADLPLG